MMESVLLLGAAQGQGSGQHGPQPRSALRVHLSVGVAQFYACVGLKEERAQYIASPVPSEAGEAFAHHGVKCLPLTRPQPLLLRGRMLKPGRKGV